MAETKVDTPVSAKPAAPKVKRDVSINPSRMKPAEYSRTVYHASIEHMTTKEDMLQPKFWAHVAVSMKPGDRIEAMAQDGTFYAELLVVASDRNWSAVHLLSYHDLTKTSMNLNEEVSDEYSVVFKGPKQWCVVRKIDNAILQDKLHSQDDGMKWLEIHLKQKVAA